MCFSEGFPDSSPSLTDPLLDLKMNSFASLEGILDEFKLQRKTTYNQELFLYEYI
jgi:hypothetical protein